MSEPNLKRHRWLAVDKPNCAINPVMNARQAVDAEVLQLAELQRQYLERICELEKALEQSLASSNELRQKLKDQYLLETQLAATEEIANLQQQVINELKHQLAQQQSMNVQYIQARIHFVPPSTRQLAQVDLPAFLTQHRKKDLQVGAERPPLKY